MTFVDAAIELLKREGGPLSVEVLAERATTEGLLARPSKNPLSAMKARLTTELKRGDDSRIVKIEDGVFALAGDDEDGEVEEAESPEGFEEESEDEESEDEESEDEESEDEESGDATAADSEGEPERTGRRRRRRRRRRRGGGAGGNGVSAEALEERSADDAAGDDAGDDDLDDDDDDEEEIDPANLRREIDPQSPEEEELAELYADESEVVDAADRSEYRDHQTEDEDRQMLPAIKADRRRRRGRDRDRDRDRDRKKGGRGRGRDRDRDRDRDSKSDARGESAVAASDLIGQVAEILADSGDRSMQWSQAASALRKRANRGEPVEDLTPALRRAVLVEEATAARLGVAPRVTARGKDRVGLGRRESADLYPLLARLEDEVRVALTHKLSALGGRKLEVLVAAYLEHIGHADIEWVKRVDPSSYAMVTAPGGESILVSARSGAKPVDRRGVGELRAGVAAKKLRSGTLVAPQPLSPEAVDELAKEGPPIAVLCGPQLIGALVDAGLGVATRTFTVRSVDDGFFDRL